MISIRAEIASEPRQLTVGLMGRKYLPSNAGMLFVFGSERPLSFWMANTYIPLQIAFIKNDGTIGQIESMVPLSTRAVTSQGRYKYALEVNDGWFEQNNIKVGDTLAMPALGVDPGQAGQAPQAPQSSPKVAIEQSYKDILKAVDQARGAKVIVKWSSKSGHEHAPMALQAPIEFGASADGDADGLITILNPAPKMDGSNAYISILIANIEGIWDLQGNPITSAQQVTQMGQKKGNNLL